MTTIQFVNHGKLVPKPNIPTQVPTNTLTTASDTYLEDPDNLTPFIKSGGDKALSLAIQERQMRT